MAQLGNRLSDDLCELKIVGEQRCTSKQNLWMTKAEEKDEYIALNFKPDRSDFVHGWKRATKPFLTKTEGDLHSRCGKCQAKGFRNEASTSSKQCDYLTQLNISDHRRSWAWGRISCEKTSLISRLELEQWPLITGRDVWQMIVFQQ